MIFAIDFDGTIVEDRYPEIGELKPEAEKFIRALQQRGDKWILWTMRGGEKLNEAVKFLESHGLKPDAVNDNLEIMKMEFPLGNQNPRKVFAHVYIDDRNEGGLKFSRYAFDENGPAALLTAEQAAIIDKCGKLKELLLVKNRKYGNSALEPCRIFSRANAVEQILVRIDDKLNRIKNRQNDEDEDVVMDLAGYLILLMIAKEKEGGK